MEQEGLFLSILTKLTTAAAMLTAGSLGYALAGRPVTPHMMTPATQIILVGQASVVDGDTINIRGERIRLNGIDAPESSQWCEDEASQKYRCGRTSAEALSSFLAASSPTSCEFVERDQHGRFVGNCRRADGESVNNWLVHQGYAIDFPRHSGGAFASAEAEARQAGRGMWAGKFEKPWEWRREQEAPGTQASGQPVARLVGSVRSGNCDIKGNIANDGERIYHVPGQQHYSRTKITPGKGERWFCSEEEARNAGWRRAKK